jgi:hypothetical protein
MLASQVFHKEASFIFANHSEQRAMNVSPKNAGLPGFVDASSTAFHSGCLTPCSLGSDNFGRSELTKLSNVISEPDPLEEKHEIPHFSQLACARNAQLCAPATQPVKPG